jgi:hypothetical protein
MKTDIEGTDLWVRTFGGSGYDEVWSVVPADDSFVLAGWTQSFGTGDWDAYVIKVNAPPASALALINMYYDKVSLPEGRMSFQIRIVRSDVVDTTCSVTYRTEAGSAVAGQDYLGQTGVIVTFKPSETAKVIRVFIIDDKLKEPFAETFTVRLTGASGATVGSRDATTCEIRANDPLGV